VRVSGYIIYAPVPNEDRVLLVHGYTGAVDLVSREVAEYLRAHAEGGNGNGFAPRPPTLEKLRSRGYLTELTADQEEEYLCNLAEHVIGRHRQRTSFVIIPTYRCQLRCPYCFELPLYGQGKEFMGQRMDHEKVDAVFAVMERLQPDPRKVVGLTLFGGEPLLKENVELISYIVGKARRVGYRVDGVSNGVDLDHYLDLLGPDGIYRLQITLDGPPEQHDQRRRGPGYKETFWRIADNITRALERNVIIAVRSNVDVTNIAGLDRLADIYAQQGWTNFANFKPYAAVVHSPIPRKQEKLIDAAVLLHGLTKQAQSNPNVLRIGRDFGVDGKMAALLSGNVLNAWRGAFCGAHQGMYVFDSQGGIYTCWEAAGYENRRIGTYHPDFSIVQPALDVWLNRTILNVPQCRKCPYALFHGGGCAEHVRRKDETMLQANCEGFPEVFTTVAPAAYQRWIEHRRKQSESIPAPAIAPQ
jgi:uncharacterized protein